MQRVSVLSFSAAFLLLSSIHADAVVNVLDVSDIATFEAANNGGVTNVNIEQWSSTVTTGGGEFVLNGTSCTSDHGVTLRDAGGHCYYRQHSGPVHLSWYGVVSSTDLTSATNTTTQLNAALAAAAANTPGSTPASSASRTVDTDGMRIYVNGNITIPADTRLTCSATPGLQHNSMSKPNFSQTPSTIVIADATHSINLSNDNAQFDHCILLTTGVVTAGVPNILFNPTNVPQAMQNNVNMVANSSTAVICSAEACNIHDNLIAGFDTGIEANGAPHLRLDANSIDADVGIFLTNTGSRAFITNTEVQTALEGPNRTDAIPLPGVTSGTGGACRYTIASLSAIGDYALGDPVNAANIQGPYSCNGTGLVTAINATTSPYYIEVASLSFAAPTGVTGSWAKGSSVISVSSATGIRQGQVVSCSSCSGSPNGATVVDVSPYLPAGTPGPTPYRVVISAPTASTGSGSLNFGNSSWAGGEVNVFSGYKPMSGQSNGGKATYGYNSTTHTGTGTCLQVGSDSGTDTSTPAVKVANFSCFGHEIPYSFINGGPSECANCTADDHANIDDLGMASLLIRGSAGEMNFANVGLNQSGGVIVDSSTPVNCMRISNAALVPFTEGTIALLAVNGCVDAANFQAFSQNASDFVFEQGAALPVTGTLTGSVSSKTSVYFDNATAQAAVSCINNILGNATCQNALPQDLASTGPLPSCGTGCTMVTGTNTAMEVTSSSSVTSETVNFAGAGFVNMPTCVVSRRSTGTARANLTTVAVDHITIGFSAAVSGDLDDVVCVGH